MLSLTALSLAIWVYLLLGHGYFWQAGPTLAPARLTNAPPTTAPPGAAPPNTAPPTTAPPTTAPPVTIVVPARDEAQSIGRALTSLLAQDYPGPFKIILVDDRSADGTGEIARGITDPRLTILEGTERPVGWSGKLWALSQGVAAADGELILLTDADIEHAPAHLSTLVDKLTRDRLDLVSEMVALNCASLAEQALVPAFVFFFAMLYPFDRVNDPGDPTAAAAGGTILIRAKTLQAIGGLAAMRGALIDDVTLAGLVKKQGRIWLGHSQLAASIRPYPAAADVWRMIARTAYVQLRYSPWLLAGTVLGMTLVWLLPPAVALCGHGPARLVAAAAWLAQCVAYLPTLRRFGQSPAWAPFLPLTALFYTAATLGSALDHIQGRGVRWKRRSYG